jgi:hypothetical protein
VDGVADHPIFELRRFDVICPECRYDLRATVTISGARCPECGARLPFDHLRFSTRPTRAEIANAMVALLVPLLALGVVVLWVLSRSWGWPARLIDLGLLAAGWWLVLPIVGVRGVAMRAFAATTLSLCIVLAAWRELLVVVACLPLLIRRPVLDWRRGRSLILRAATAARRRAGRWRPASPPAGASGDAGS